MVKKPKRGAFIRANGILTGVIKREQEALESPKKRLPIPNIPAIPISMVSIASKLPGEKRTNKRNFPETARYEPIGNNVAGEGLPEKIKMAINEGLKRKNQIRCSCGPSVDCSKNLSCHCNRMAKFMAAEFTNKLQLQYGKSVPIIDAENAFWKDMFFNCGDDCTCSSCKMNALRDLKEENFHVLRTDGRGFCVYSVHGIKQGQPVVSFNGEIVGYSKVNSSNLILQYALRVIEEEKEFSKWAKKAPGLTESYKQILEQAFLKAAWINPLTKGNCSRFLSHSCTPNVSMRRIFQGGLSPANMRIVMFADKDIKPGEEVTFDYGELYKKTHLTDCLCTHCKELKNEKQKLRRMRSSRSVDSTQSSSSSGSVVPLKKRKQQVQFKLENIKREVISQERDTPERAETSETSNRFNFRHIVVKQEIVSDNEDDDEDDEDFVPVSSVQLSRHPQESAQISERPRRVVIKKEEPDDYDYEPPIRRSSSRIPVNTEILTLPVASTHGMTLRCKRQPSVPNACQIQRIAMSVPPRNTSRSDSVGRLRQPAHAEGRQVHRPQPNVPVNCIYQIPPEIERSVCQSAVRQAANEARSIRYAKRLLRSHSQEIC